MRDELPRLRARVAVFAMPISAAAVNPSKEAYCIPYNGLHQTILKISFVGNALSIEAFRLDEERHSIDLELARKAPSKQAEPLVLTGSGSIALSKAAARALPSGDPP